MLCLLVHSHTDDILHQVPIFLQLHQLKGLADLGKGVDEIELHRFLDALLKGEHFLPLVFILEQQYVIIPLSDIPLQIIIGIQNIDPPTQIIAHPSHELSLPLGPIDGRKENGILYKTPENIGDLVNGTAVLFL